MKISAFSFCRNVHTLFYPFQESIQSVLPIVDEFIIAVGAGDVDDKTLQMINEIRSDKIRIVNTVWDTQKFPGGTEYARQTDIAKQACSGDWLLYLQADEVIHEADLPNITSRCRQLLHNPQIDGLVFDYLHFWGDYDHYHNSHGWYPREIRVIRNRPDIHSWVDAQSFRRIPDFDGKSFAQREGTFKLNVAHANARVFHYGWVRPPDFMLRKKHIMDVQYHGNSITSTGELFEYGDLSRIPRFQGTHPAIMQKRIAEMDWKEALDYTGAQHYTRAPFKHEKPVYRALTWIEQHQFGGNQIGGFKNYNLIHV